MNPDWDLLVDAVTAALLTDTICAALTTPPQPHSRPGSPLMFTDDEWELWDEWNALEQAAMRKYGGGRRQSQGGGHRTRQADAGTPPWMTSSPTGRAGAA